MMKASELNSTETAALELFRRINEQGQTDALRLMEALAHSFPGAPDLMPAPTSEQEPATDEEAQRSDKVGYLLPEDAHTKLEWVGNSLKLLDQLSLEGKPGGTVDIRLLGDFMTLLTESFDSAFGEFTWTGRDS